MVQNKRQRRMISLLFKMTAIVITAYFISYAWFRGSIMFSSGNIEFDVETHNEIEISLDYGTTWESIADLNIASEFTFKKPVTSNGIDFYYLNTVDESDNPETFAQAVANRDYLEYVVLFRSKRETTVFLNETSYVIPKTGTASSHLIGFDVERKSLYGAFSKDIIAGAVRVSIIENDIIESQHIPKTETKLVWAPNKNYKLSKVNDNYTASITSSDVQNYNYIKVNSPSIFEEQRVINLKENISASHAVKTANGDPHLLILQDDIISSITIRIWVEGNDRETDIALKGGLFNISLSFVGINKQHDITPPVVSEDLILNKINNYDNTMEHSTDYGNQWIKYSENNDPTFSNNQVVYVRKQETGIFFASAHTILEY